MRDTVDLNPAGVFLLEKLFSRQERAKLFRTWAGAASMLLKGGDAIWGKFRIGRKCDRLAKCAGTGDKNGAPDDAENATLSTKHMCMYRIPSGCQSFNLN
jgi:phospholipid:diacylglycerol acyltransferase